MLPQPPAIIIPRGKLVAPVPLEHQWQNLDSPGATDAVAPEMPVQRTLDLCPIDLFVEQKVPEDLEHLPLQRERDPD